MFAIAIFVAATAITERMTVGAVVQAPEPKANDKDRSNHPETVLRGDTERTACVTE
jgi:hypothetical protein